MEHEFSLRTELDSAWAIRPLELMQYKGRTILVLEDPGGEPLDQLLRAPMELGKFIRVAIGASVALRRLYIRGVVHKDVKPPPLIRQGVKLYAVDSRAVPFSSREGASQPSESPGKIDG